jgi:hypothetical protein
MPVRERLLYQIAHGSPRSSSTRLAARLRWPIPTARNGETAGDPVVSADDVVPGAVDHACEAAPTRGACAMSLQLSEAARSKLDGQIEHMVHDLAAKHHDQAEDELRAWSREELDRLLETARFPDFVPVLVYHRLNDRVHTPSGG